MISVGRMGIIKIERSKFMLHPVKDVGSRPDTARASSGDHRTLQLFFFIKNVLYHECLFFFSVSARVLHKNQFTQFGFSPALIGIP